MNRRNILTITLLAALAAGTPALAQIGNMEKFEVTSAIMSAGTAALKVRKLREVPSIGILSVSFRNSLGVEQIREYQMLAGRYSSKIMRLRAALRANPVTRHVLREHHVDIDAIVGVRVGTYGALRVFVR